MKARKFLCCLLTAAVIITQIPFQAYAADKITVPVQDAAVSAEAAVYSSSDTDEMTSSLSGWTEEEKNMYVKLLNNLHKNINRKYPDLKLPVVKWSSDLEYVSEVKLDYQYQYYFKTGKGFNAHVYHNGDDHDRLVEKMNGIFLDPGEYTLQGIAGPPYFYLENESYSAGTDPVLPTALNIYDIISRYLTEKYNPDNSTGHAQALLGAAEVGSKVNVIYGGSSAEFPYALHEIVTYKGDTLNRSCNSDSALSEVAASFYKKDAAVANLLKDPDKSSKEPADYSKFNEAYNSIPMDLSGFSPENRIILNGISQEAIMLDRNLKADSQDFIDCHTLAIKKLLEKDRNSDADYSRVDEALKRIPADLSLYTEKSAAKVTEAEARIRRGLKKKDQAVVDGFAEDLNNAIDGLVKKTLFDESSISLPSSFIPVKTGYKIPYSGKTIRPVPVVKAGGRLLEEGKDYKVIYSNPDSVNPGAYSFTVTGTGDCRGDVLVDYVIVPSEVSSFKARLLTGSGGYDDVYLTWTKVKGASGYSVKYRKTGSSKWSSSTRTTGTSLKKTNLSDGRTYEFSITPYYRHHDVRYMAVKNRTVKITTLKKVKLNSVSRCSSSKVRVKWTNIAGESGYQISRSSKKTGTYILSSLRTTKGGSLVVKAPAGKPYYYKVRAYRTFGDRKVYGPWSSVKYYKNK